MWLHFVYQILFQIWHTCLQKLSKLFKKQSNMLLSASSVYNKQVMYKKVCNESNLRNGACNNNAPAHSLSSVQELLANTVMTVTLHPLYPWILVPCAFVSFPEIHVGTDRQEILWPEHHSRTVTGYTCSIQIKDIHRCSHNGTFNALTVSNCKETNLNGNIMELHVNAGITDSRIMPGNFIMLCTLGTCDIVPERSVMLKHKY